MKKIEDLKVDYESIEIPAGLEASVNKGIRRYNRSRAAKRAWKAAGFTAAALAVVFTGALNLSPVFARAVGELPIVGGLVRVLGFRQYTLQTDNFNVNMDTPQVEGLEDAGLQSSLNQRYVEENKRLYEEFTKDMETFEGSGAHLGMETGYVVKTDTEQLLSIGRYVFNVAGSSSTKFQYDTIDKRNNILITLPSLFKDEAYIDAISQSIIAQMKHRRETEEGVIFFDGTEDYFEPFTAIRPDQSFYITSGGKLVISFDKYEIAPGYMGVVEFEIPTEALKGHLAGDAYIR